jgi:hypothetical protein
MQTLEWYRNRLSLMSPGEIAWRARQAIEVRVRRWLPEPRIPKARVGAVTIVPWGTPESALAGREVYLAAADRVLSGQLDLFGEWVSIASIADPWNTDPVSGIVAPRKPADTIDYRDATLVGSARNVWEVNRHFQLVTVAQAFRLTRAGRYRDAGLKMVRTWLRDAPYPLGLNWISALEHGIRLINWYLAARLLREDGSVLAADPTWLYSIYRHCEFICRHRSRHSSANNHLIGEMAGLYVASVAWPCWDRSNAWRAEAKAILEREVQLQVHADGTTREQTVGYQMFVLQFLIIAGLVGESAGDAFSIAYWVRVRQMILFLRSIVDAGGHLPDFGDSDEGMAFMLSPEARNRRYTDLAELALVWDGEHDGHLSTCSLAAWLGSGFPRPSNWRSSSAPLQRAFPEGGYYVLGEKDGTAAEVRVVFDAAPLGYLSIAAHGHADCLSFTLSLGGEQFLIDPGTYCYHTEREWRDYFRGTSAHNTVRVDRQDQSEIGGPFMWVRKAQPAVHAAELGEGRQRVRASHDGYRKLASPVVHTREIGFEPGSGVLNVQDEIEATGAHVVERFWHFAEHCEVRQIDSRTVTATGRSATLTLRCAEDCGIEVLRGSRTPRAGWISRRFGSMQPTTSVVVTNSVASSVNLGTRLEWTF